MEKTKTITITVNGDFLKELKAECNIKITMGQIEFDHSSMDRLAICFVHAIQKGKDSITINNIKKV